INYQLSSPGSVGQAVIQADLVVGAVLIRGQKAPFVVTKAMVKKMQPGAVIVDVSIDQGGCVETSRPTSHLDPVFQQYGVVHYCVTNMPGAYPKTSTLALTQATLPYIQKLADQGMRALQADKGFMKGVNTDQGKIVNPDVADNF
ncbi:MAG TPA: alanine dehydrogenase, partial [Gammaproteobacteria bacterium]|nr:alanine dehydrogenase [Gammaproteobacteria bacterium]